MSKLLRIEIANTRDSVYQERLAEGKLLIMPSAKESLVGCKSPRADGLARDLKGGRCGPNLP